MRAAIPYGTAGGGAIVNVHPAGVCILGQTIRFMASKAAVASLTQCLGIDHAPQGIRVNVCPNEVNTP